MAKKLSSVKKVVQTSPYSRYFKTVPKDVSEIDVYAVHSLFKVGESDSSGAIKHASKKLLLAGTRTGSKSLHKDITEARDSLNRWLEMHDAGFFQDLEK